MGRYINLPIMRVVSHSPFFAFVVFYSDDIGPVNNKIGRIDFQKGIREQIYILYSFNIFHQGFGTPSSRK